MTDQPRILLFAYHNVGYECLGVLARKRANVVGLFSHEDNPKEEIWFKSVAGVARRLRIPVYTPPSVNNPEWVNRIRQFNPDVIFSFYYRNMIREDILRMPRLGAFNIHGSLLPKYRGRVPVNWAVLNGETATGVTLHHMVKQADAGDIVDQEPVPIGPDDTALVVFNKVTVAARTVLERQFESILAGTAPRRQQDESEATYFGGRKPEDGRIEWTDNAEKIYNLIRAVTHPYPGAFTDVNGERFFIWHAKPLDRGAGRPGEVISTSPLRVATGLGSIEIVRCQWARQPEVDASSGEHGLRAGTLLGR